MFIKPWHLSIVLVGLAVLVLSGCDSTQQLAETPNSVKVSVLTPQARTLLVTEDLPGRVTAIRSAEIRAQVGGILQHRLFEEGAEIKAGSVLFQINPAPFKVDVDIAAAALQHAEAVLERARLEVDRLVSLTEAGGVSRQVYDDAVSLRNQARANVAQAQATLARRKLDLQFASVEAPIDGRIDQALVSEGALVSPTDATPLARIQQINQVYVDIRLPASELETMRQLAGTAGSNLAVDILSSDGKPLGIQGHILFSGTEVNVGTGDVLLRVLVDNPDYRLLPGLYVQARIAKAYYTDALSVPQQAVTRTAGQASVWIVDANDKAELVAVELGELVGRDYRVISGLSAGQSVVIEGIERLSPAIQVVTRPWQSAAESHQLSANQH